MRQTLFVSILVMLGSLVKAPVHADERAMFYGSWGTAKQCARAPIKEGGSVHAAPFQINDEWLQHGPLWCRLKWFPMEERDGSVFSGAFAQCGEDAVLSYLLRMTLEKDQLTLRWDLTQKNGPLARCLSD